MVFEQFYLQCLSHASYLVGDEGSGRAVVVDPQRDVGLYVDAAAAHGVTIERVIETHVHADFLSGHLELAAQTGAVISYGAGAEVEFAIEPLTDGARLSLGDVTLEIRATPGHTPESISVVVYEHADAAPFGVLTGDTLFIGDVGRPDLLTTAGSGISADDLARRLYHSLHDTLLKLPDATQVFPAHGAGSACGKHLSTETSSTMGEQRRTNYALAPMTEDHFVAIVTEGQPVAPAYFSYDASRNREDRPLLDEGAPAPVLDLDAVLAGQAAGAVLLDTRSPTEFAAAHLRGAINVGLQGRFAEYAGDALDPEEHVVLVGNPDTALEAKVRLARIGFDRVDGSLDDLVVALRRRPDVAEPGSRLTAARLRRYLHGPEKPVVIDVRGPGEIEADGAIPGATNIPLPRIATETATLDHALPTVVYCASGYRSSVAASMLRAAGFTDVSDLIGGYDAWTSSQKASQP
jgi:glyoxylase-like metal-dependent hydrolase (beta-lactamase superfamily II)/rhodanese-related sulfurtransferase